MKTPEERKRDLDGILKAYILKEQENREVSPEVKRVKAMRETKAADKDINDFQGNAVNRSRYGRWKY